MDRNDETNKEAAALAYEMIRQNEKLSRLRPFHETILLEIQRCNPSPSEGDIFTLLRQIRETKIPKGHNEILAAIDRYFDFPGAEKYAREIRETRNMVLLQKQAVTEKASNQAIDLDELQREVEKLLALLNDRQTGHMSWHEFMKERLENIHKLTSRALGK